MGDFLAELLDQFDPEEQAGIRDAEAVAEGMLAQGIAPVKDRALHLEDDPQAHAAGEVFRAYVNALWRQTDPARAESIQEFLAKADKLPDPVVAKYGPVCEGLIADFRAQYHTKIDFVLQISTASEVSAVKPNAILESAELWRMQQSRNKDLQAAYARIHENPCEGGREEKRLKNARAWAEAALRELVPEVRDLSELKERVVKQTFDKFIGNDSYFLQRFREFAAALWEEGWPSLEDRAILAIRDSAASAASQVGAVVTGSPVEGRGEDTAPLATVSFQGIAKGATHMGNPSRPEIEKFANEAFSVARDDILAKYAEKLNQLPGQVQLRGNSGGYLPALIKWGTARVRKMVPALADAYVEAFTLHGVPLDAQAEMDLETTAQQIAAGTTSEIRGHLQLRSVRLRIAEEGRGVPWHLKIEKAMRSALKEGVLRLRRKRIKFKGSESRTTKDETTSSAGAQVKGTSVQQRLASRLKKLKTQSDLTWDTIAKESHVSRRWLLNIAAGQTPSPATRTTLAKYFSRILHRPVRF
jgi:hypothetical protein